MAKKYCKKSSIQAVADEIRVRGGFPNTYKIQGGYMATEISNLEKPVNRGSPSVTLTASSPSYTVQEGKYTGGSVSVVPQNATATLSQNGSYVPVENGKTLASVKVPAKNTVSYAVGKITPSDRSTSIQVDGLSFSPVGFVVMCTSPGGLVAGSAGALATVCCYKQGGSYVATGFLPNQTAYFGVVTSASASFGGSSFSVSNVVGVRNGSTINTVFRNREYCWFAWG